MRPRIAVVLSMLAVAGALSGQAHAQADPARAYPGRPVRVIVGFAAGGGTDIVARLVGQKISESLGQPIVVENRIGASGIISAEYVAKMPPDGYTLLMSPSTVFTVNPVMFTKLPYSPTADFAPISKVVSFPLLMIVNAAEPIRSVKELVDQLRANPRKANFAGSAGIFQLALEMFRLRTGLSVEYIPYKGTNEVASAVMAGNALMAVVDSAPVAAAIRGGKLRALAVTSGARAPAFPEIPTMAESGFPDMEITGWMGMFAPAGTPAAIVRRLQDEIIRAVRLPEIRERMQSLYVDPAGDTSEEFARSIAADITRWAGVVKAANIKPAN